MKSAKRLHLFLITIISFTLPSLIFAEGSKELYITTYNTGLYCCNDFVGKCNNGNGDRSQFAIFACNEQDRLYFVKLNPTETIYLGFNGNIQGSSHIVFRIKDMSGTIVYTEANLPTAGTGFIANIGAARVGPSQIYGAGGYTAINFHPAATGTFYIEFNRKNAGGAVTTGGFNLDLFDITVYDTVSNVVKPGRLYCKSWQFTESDNCSAKTYVYSNDSIITSALFNDMSGGTWIQFCNQYGCFNTGNFPVDRKSLWHLQSLLPQYKIFLNIPDTIIFKPATTLGQIIPPNPWGERFCDNGNITFHVNVNKPGNVEIDLVFGPPYLTRILNQIVTVGENLINWDGLDGTLPVGQPIPNNTTVTFTLKYINGLTNMPFYDVEGNPNGFVIDIVAPSGATPLVYWDDTNITGPPAGGANFTGCLSPPGCHTWSGSGNGWGNLNTINTWWYNVSATTSQAYIVEFRKPQPLVFVQNPPQSYCAGATGIIFSVSADPNTTEYHFSYTGTGASITHINPTYPFIIVDFAANATSGSIEVYGTNTNCTGSGPTSSLPVTINPAPSLDPPLTKNICSGNFTNINLISTPPGAFCDWVSPSPTCTPNIVACPPGNMNATLINDFLSINNLVSGSVTYHISPSLNGCSGQTQDYLVTVNPLPDVVINSAAGICSGQMTNIQLSSTISGATFTWNATGSSPNVSGFSPDAGNSIAQTLTNSGNVTETVTYYIMPSVNGCSPTTTTNFTISVYPTPDLLNNPRNKNICSASPTNITLTSKVAGTLFTWTASGSSVLVTGFYNNATPSGLLNQILINSGFTTETVTYHITPHANGCDGQVTDFVVTVYPTPNLSNNPLSKLICNNTATNIPLSSNVTGTLFTWTCTPSSGNLSGFYNNITPSGLLNQTLINSGFTTETVTYHITPHANGCDGPVTDFMVTVYPSPNLSNTPPSKQICNNTATNITLTSNVAGTLFTWTCTPSSGNLSGFYNNITPSGLLDQTLINSGFTTETVTYHVLPHANGCNGTVTDYVVTVYPVPDLSNNPPNMQVCNNTPTNQTLISNVSGTLFTWTATGSSPLITGYSDNAIPTVSLNQTLFNSGLNVEFVTYHITPHSNGCIGPVTDYVVTVVSSPDVYFSPPAQTICSQQISSIQVLSHVPGTTFTWTTTASSPNLSGYSNSGGNLIAQTVTNSGTTIETVTYTVSPFAWGCPPGSPQNVILTVNPKPAVTNPVTSFQQCSAATTNIALQSSVPGSTFTWTANGSSLLITGYLAGAGNNILQTLVNTGFNIETVTYNVTPGANGCTGNPASFTVTVFPVPDVYFTPPSQTLCPLQSCNILNNSHVSGASYTWTATGSSLLVSGYSSGSGNQILQPLNNTGYSIETVTYHVSPTANGCPGINGNVVVTVNPKPAVTFTPCWDNITTTSAQPIRLKGGTPLYGTYSGTGVNAGIFSPAVSGIGTFNITYTCINQYGCNSTASQSITVISPLFFNCGNNLTDIRDNKSYPTVLIGTQCWMAANLDYGSSLAGNLTQRDNCTPEKFCYNDNPANCTSSGGLYQWDELMQYSNAPSAQGFCPPSWHIPTENEWNTLFSFYISNGFAGSPLKYSGYSGFNAYLNGARFKNVSWDYNNFATFFWSSTLHGAQKAWAHGMNDYNPSVSFYPGNRANAFSVRCIKD